MIRQKAENQNRELEIKIMLFMGWSAVHLWTMVIFNAFYNILMQHQGSNLWLPLRNLPPQ